MTPAEAIAEELFKLVPPPHYGTLTWTECKTQDPTVADAYLLAGKAAVAIVDKVL